VNPWARITFYARVLTIAANFQSTGGRGHYGSETRISPITIPFAAIPSHSVLQVARARNDLMTTPHSLSNSKLYFFIFGLDSADTAH
jgi:hypothetical protein